MNEDQCGNGRDCNRRGVRVDPRCAVIKAMMMIEKMVSILIFIRWQQFVQAIIKKQGFRCDISCLGMNILFFSRSPCRLFRLIFLQVYLLQCYIFHFQICIQLHQHYSNTDIKHMAL